MIYCKGCGEYVSELANEMCSSCIVDEIEFLKDKNLVISGALLKEIMDVYAKQKYQEVTEKALEFF